MKEINKLVTSLVCLLAINSWGLEALKVGETAPNIKLDHWMLGSPETELGKGTVYVVEFWATWCGPCLRSVPHLSELQKKYKDKKVQVLGIAAFEQQPTLKEQIEGMESFLNHRDNRKSFAYPIGIDQSGKMKQQWFEAAGQEGIPVVFVVDGKGKITYIGSPVALENEVDKALANK